MPSGYSAPAYPARSPQAPSAAPGERLACSISALLSSGFQFPKVVPFRGNRAYQRPIHSDQNEHDKRLYLIQKPLHPPREFFSHLVGLYQVPVEAIQRQLSTMETFAPT